MAIDGITAGITIKNPTAVARQNIQTAETAPLEAVPVNTIPQVEVSQSVSLQNDALIQNEELVNEVLRNLLFQNNQLQTGQLFETRSPQLTVLSATQDLPPLQQNALQVNEILRNLNIVPREPANTLLLNEISPALEAAGVSSSLNLVEDNAQLVNDVLQTLGSVNTESPVDQIRPEANVESAIAASVRSDGAPLPTAQNVVAGTEEADSAVITTQTPGALQTGNVTPQVVATPESVTFDDIPIPLQGPTPATLPLSLFPDRSQYVHAAYLINNPTPPPDIPEPKGSEVQPVAPVAENQAVGIARFRQLLQSAKEDRRTNEPENPAARINVAQAEKSIRMTLDQVNADMAAHRSPLHLVFARHGKDLALNVYDCSSNESCRLSYDVPIELDNMAGVLNNLEHESGIIVNTLS